MADGRERQRRDAALAHIESVGRRLTEDQRVTMLDQLLLLLIDQLSMTEAEVSIDAAAKLAKRLRPTPMGPAVTEQDPGPWIDRHGDVWTLGGDGLLHTPETAPFSREHVERKWGPLREMPRLGATDEPNVALSLELYGHAGAIIQEEWQVTRMPYRDSAGRIRDESTGPGHTREQCKAIAGARHGVIQRRIVATTPWEDTDA